MNITAFLKTPEADKLSKMYDDFIGSTETWDASQWRSSCVRYAIVTTAIELFLDEDYNRLNIRDNATAQEIWDGVLSWYHHNAYAAEILAVEDDCWIQFESAFEDVIAHDDDGDDEEDEEDEGE